MEENPPRKDELIQIRACAATKEILVRAASLRGQSLSEFMLESARAGAEETIHDQRLFVLQPDAYERFIGMLDVTDKPHDALRAKLRRKPTGKRDGARDQRRRFAARG